MAGLEDYWHLLVHARESYVGFCWRWQPLGAIRGSHCRVLCIRYNDLNRPNRGMKVWDQFAQDCVSSGHLFSLFCRIFYFLIKVLSEFCDNLLLIQMILDSTITVETNVYILYCESMYHCPHCYSICAMAIT